MRQNAQPVIDDDLMAAVLSVLEGQRHQSIVVACSMGRDSLVLLHLCHRLYQAGKIERLSAIHVHHHLQACADDWAKSFLAFCQAHQIYHQVLHVYPEDNEQAARKARYEAIAYAMGDDELLLTAHHKNDQCETVLMRLINGAGVLGLSGIKSSVSHTATTHHPKTITICRPFLGTDRQIITQYAHKHKLDFVNDPSNHQHSTRAHLRQIMPALHAINARAMDNIVRTSQIAADLHQITSNVATGLMPPIIVSDADYYALDVSRLQALDLPYLRLVVYHLLGRFADDYGQHYHPNYDMIAQVIALILRQDSDHKTQIFWAGASAIIHRYRQHLYVMRDGLYQDLMAGVLPMKMEGAQIVGQIGRQDKVLYHHRTLSGKKLYQNLGIAPIFRQSLYLCEHRHVRYLASLNVVWRLQDDAQDDVHLPLPSFYLSQNPLITSD